MRRPFSKKLGPGYIATNLSSVLGIVLIWRGIWYLLDAIDMQLFGGSHAATAALGIVAGVVVLYLPKQDLRALEKL